MKANRDGSCERCGGALRRERVMRAIASSLPDVIVDGLERATCEACGATSTVYPRWAALGRIVVEALLDKPGRLAPGEVTYLRGLLGRQKDLAEQLGVTATQVSRWENGAVAISSLADRLLRAIVAADHGLALPNLRRIDVRRTEPVSLRVALGDDGWYVVGPERAAG